MDGERRASGERWAEQAGEAAARAGDVAQAAGARLADLAGRADERVAEVTGRPASAWLGELRALVRDHPLPAIALTLGLGYVVGKILRR
ncbi:MAG TPA: hypothetical protein VNO23_01005 [Candidatus Binatia bacterium]|nr:hypothetical protein [Candidatus Binatia bacterium]